MTKNEKIAESMKGNKNAEKYSIDDAVKLFKDSIKLALSTEPESTTYKFDFIGEVARELKIYHELYIHLVNRFPELDHLFSELKQTLEANCYSNSKKGKIREATAIVNLKSNHGWRDRQEVKHEGEIANPTQVNLSPDQLTEVIDSLKPNEG